MRISFDQKIKKRFPQVKKNRKDKERSRGESITIENFVIDAMNWIILKEIL